MTALIEMRPLDLFTPRRLDLVVKLRFFRHLAHGGDPDAERVYRWHIQQRTGGREPGSWKQSVDDYVRGALAMISSMEARGFDPAYPIRVGSNGRLQGGAHRTACAQALGLHVVPARRTKTPGRAAAWDHAWFVRNGAHPQDLDRIIRDLHALTAEVAA